MNVRASFLCKITRWQCFFALLVLNPKNSPADETKPGAGQRSPNIVILFIDDMGYADIGPFGQPPTKLLTWTKWRRKAASSPISIPLRPFAPPRAWD